MKTKHGRRKMPSKEPQPNANAAFESPAAEEQDDGIELRVTRLNLRFVSVLLAGVVVLGVSLLLVHAYQTRKNAAVFKERAHAALEQGDFAKAITLLDRYVGMRPHDIDALIQLGDLRSDRAVTGQQFQNAFSIYERVLAQEPDRHDVRRRHVDVAMHLGRYSDAITHLAVLVDAVRKGGSQPEELTDNEEDESSAGSLPDLLILAGDCHYTLAKMPEAIGLYLQALALAPEAINGYRGLAYALQQTSEPPPRNSLLGPVPREFQLDFKTAPQAARHWSELQALFPSSEESAGAKAALVESVLKRMADLGRPLPRALLTRAKFRTQILSQDDRFSIEAQRENRRAQLDAAREDLDAALALSPDDRDVLLASTDLALTQADARRSEGESDDALLEQARRDAERGIKQSPPDLRFFQLLSQIELATDDEPRETFHRAEEHLKSALELVPEIVKGASPREQRVIASLDGEIRWQLADVLITSAQLASPPDKELLARAREIVDALQRNNARSPLIEFLASRLTMIVQRDQPDTWHRVAQKLHSIRHDLRSRRDLVRRVDLMLGECYQRLANPDARIGLYRRALAEDPLWVQGRLELASVLAEQNQIDDSLREYNLISGVPGVALQMARLIILRNLTRPETVERPRQWEPILRLLNEGEKLAPDDVQFSVLRAQVLTLQKEYASAQQILETALESRSDEPAVWAALVSLELRREDREPEERLQAAEQLLARAGKQLGDRVELRLAAADLAVARGADTALALVELEADTETLRRDERLLLLEGLARAHGRIDDSKDARRIWMQLATENPHDLRYQLIAVTAAQAEGDVDELRPLLARIREVEGAGGANGNVVEASLLIREANESRGSGRNLRSQLARPRDLLQRAAQERPSWAAVPELLGHLETALGNDDLAIEHYERAISLGSRSTRVIERLVALLYDRERYQDADRVLAGMAREHPELISGNLAQWQAEIAWQQEHFDRALRVARDRAHASTDPQDAIWRARFLIAWYYKLLADGRSEEAEPLVAEADRLYRDAIESNPDRPAIWLAYVRHLARLSEIQRAEAVIREAQDHLPEDPAYLAPLTLARCYEAIGNRQRAEEHFRTAAEAATGEPVVQMAFADFYARGGDFRAAEREVRKIIDQPEAPEHAVAAARRQLAYFVGIRPGATWGDARRALDMVAKLRTKDELETSTDLRIRVSILARQNAKGARLQLIDALEELARRDDLRPQEQSRLLAAYLSADRWPDARQMLERRIADDPANPQHYAELISGLLQRTDRDDDDLLAAENALLRLEALEPDSLRTRIARARLLVAQQHPARAAEMLVDYARNLQPASTDEMLQALQTEQDSEQLIDSISEYLLSQSDASARRVLMEARGLKNQGEFEDAVRVLRDYLQARANFSEIVAAETIRYIALLLEEFQQPKAAEEAWRLYADRAPLPQSQLTVAYFLARQRRYAEALDICEQSWGKVPDNVAAEHHLGVLSTALRNGVNVTERIPAIEERLRTILQDDAASPRVLSVAAAFHDLQGRFDEAERMYWLVLRQNDRNVLALNNLAFLLGLRGKRLTEAEQLINRAIELAGPAPELLDTRAIVRGAQKKSSQAIADLKLAIEQAPTATKYFHLAQIQWGAGNQAASRDALANARKLGLTRSDLHPLQHALLEQMDGRF